MRVDFTGVEGQKSFDPLPQGKYVLEVISYEEGEVTGEQSKNKGAAKISWEFAVAEDAANPEEYWGRRVWDNMTIVPKALWRLRALLEACGFEVPEGELDVDFDDVVDSTFTAKVGIQKARRDPRSGEEYPARNVIKTFYPIGGEDDD